VRYQDAQKKVYFEPFKKATGVPMNDESWDGGIGVLRAKVQGGAATWDVVQVESDELAGWLRGRLVREDRVLEDRWRGRLPAADRQFLRPSAPIVYDFVLGYDKDKLKDGPKSWGRLLRHQEVSGQSAACVRVRRPRWRLPSSPTVSRPKDVYKVLATDEGIERAFKKLDTIKNDIVWWKAGAPAAAAARVRRKWR